MSVISHFKIPGGPKIIVANHPTTSDPFILTSMSNGQASVIIKESLFDVPIFGRYLHWAGHIPIRVGQGKSAFDEALKNLKKGITVIVFIEGSVSTFVHKLKKPKTGAIRLALASNIPIIPVGIGVRGKNIKPILSKIKGVKEWGKWYFKGPYAITIGKPINLKGSVQNRTRVRKLSKWLAKKISILQNESALRINLNYGN
jgi:1-acyl-sn-glycerol-3-phosphate acyltransferase